MVISFKVVFASWPPQEGRTHAERALEVRRALNGRRDVSEVQVMSDDVITSRGRYEHSGSASGGCGVVMTYVAAELQRAGCTSGMDGFRRIEAWVD